MVFFSFFRYSCWNTGFFGDIIFRTATTASLYSSFTWTWIPIFRRWWNSSLQWTNSYWSRRLRITCCSRWICRIQVKYFCKIFYRKIHLFWNTNPLQNEKYPFVTDYWKCSVFRHLKILSRYSYNKIVLKLPKLLKSPKF